MILTATLLCAQVSLISCVSPSIHLVRIPAYGSVGGFWIGKFEVTQAQFAGFIRKTGYDGKDHPSSKPSEPFLGDWNKGKPPEGKARYPVANLNWHHAKAFAVWLAKESGRPVRLPTDAEWTLAAAGKEGRKYPWGDVFEENRCNTGTPDDGFAKSAPVGAFPLGATPQGVHDMAGNIWEWSAEGHLRGGPWCMGPDTVLCSFVAKEDIERCDDKFGLRIVVAD